ncbi:MAG: hypothetical protein KF868_18440 [Acidobacteria bacterium]|nr:hypothetical protein [Acidobacteriota bacterium]MCW5967719.1 hypothetical protein [Blastocatellales bacterium]
MEDRLNELVRMLRSAHGESFISAILYGSAVAAPGNPRASDFHLLIVLSQLGLPDLRTSRPIMKWWESFGHPRAVYFTRAEFLASIDVFPIEFRHMKRAYRVLSGEDILAAVDVSTSHLRLLVEYELRGKLLRLRSMCLPAGDDPARLMDLMTESVVSFVQYLRPVLELLGEEPPLSRLAAVRRTGERLNLDLAPVERLLRMRERGGDLMSVEIEDLLESYLDCIGRIIDAVDAI